MILQIGTTDLSDYVSALKVDKNYLTSDYSGRNAKGTMHIDVIASKYKLNVTFIQMSTEKAKEILELIKGYANISITFMNPYTDSETTIKGYIGTPSIEYYRLSNNMQMVKEFSLSFIEM